MGMIMMGVVITASLCWTSYSYASRLSCFYWLPRYTRL